MEIYETVTLKGVAVTCQRSSFIRGSNCKALTWKFYVFWIDGRLWEVGRLREVVSHGGLTVLLKTTSNFVNWHWIVSEYFMLKRSGTLRCTVVQKTNMHVPKPN